MNVLPLCQHLELFVALAERDGIEYQEADHRLGVVRQYCVGQGVEGAGLIVNGAQLVIAIVVGSDELGELGLQGGTDGRSRRGVDLHKHTPV